MSEVEIVKIPCKESDHEVPPRNFKKMPILYLELIENKSRVQPQIANKLYTPPPETDVEHTENIATRPSEPPPKENDITPFDLNEFLSKDQTLEKEEARVDDTTPIASDLLKRDDSPQPESSKVPTLAELQAKNPKNPILKKDFRYAHDDDLETIEERNKVFFHYNVLKRMHPNAAIPEFTIYSDPKVMAQKYDLLQKNLTLDSNIGNLKRYMIIFVMACEVILGKLNFDMEGFAQEQIISMSTYDSLLVEMAEKNYNPIGSKLPVEVRLLGMLMMNLVMFIVTKLIAKSTGINLIGVINRHLITPSSNGERLMKPPEVATGTSTKEFVDFVSVK